MTRLVILPDIHCPNHDIQSIHPILQFIKFYKPHYLIQLGDFCDWDSVSTYDPHRESDIQPIDKEIDSSNYLLDDIDRVTPKSCIKVMIGGNHEDRYEKFRIKEGMLIGIRRMKDMSTWQEEYNLYKRNWKVVEYGGHYQVGKIIATHGWYASSGAAKQMAECFPGRNVIFGHTHQHLVYGALDERNLPIESESIGTLSRFDLSYLRGKPAKNWVHAFMYIDMKADGTFSKHFVHVISGGFIEYGKEFKYSSI